MAAAVLFHSWIYPAVNQHVAATPSSTVGHHTTDGTDISIKAVAHGLEENMLVTLAGWTWVGGTSGVVNGTWIVKARTDADNFTLTPTVCPGTGTNPTVVGTYSVAAHPFQGARLPVSTYGLKLVLPTGWWSIRNSGRDSTGADLLSQLAYRFATSTTDVTLPVGTFVFNTMAAQKCINIEPGSDEVIEVRGSSSPLILASSSGTLVVFVRPSQRGIVH
jgi:hypothetical protein